jgi:hypothetical protein
MNVSLVWTLAVYLCGGGRIKKAPLAFGVWHLAAFVAESG